MPLPKPPAKRASLLSPSDFEAQAAARPGKRSAARPSAAADAPAPAVMDLFDSSAAATLLAPPPIVAVSQAAVAPAS